MLFTAYKIRRRPVLKPASAALLVKRTLFKGLKLLTEVEYEFPARFEMIPVVAVGDEDSVGIVEDVLHVQTRFQAVHAAVFLELVARGHVRREMAREPQSVVRPRTQAAAI